MRTQTLCFTVQLSSRGTLGVHSWRATYTPKGRQVPAQITTLHDVDPRDLDYLVTEFADSVRLAQRLWESDRDTPLPL